MRVAFALFFCLLHLPTFAHSIRAREASVLVNEMEVFTLRTAVGRTSPVQRAQQVVANLRAAGQAPVFSVRGGAEARIVAGERLIVRVTAAEARAQGGTTPSEVAAAWVGRLRAAYALPPIALEVAQVELPPEGERFVPVLGSAARKLALGSSNPAVARAVLVEGGIRILSAERGRAVITLEGGGLTRTLDVAVLPWAAPLPQALSAAVVGQPANREIVRTAAMSAVFTRLQAEPGARIRILDLAPEPVSGGEARPIPVRVRVSAPGAFPREGLVTVTVRNLGHARLREAELWYCNDPENVFGPRHLFTAELRRGHPARLLYHHINKWSQPLVIQVLVKNPHDEPARLVLIPGDGTPHSDPVRVGLEAGELFLRNWLSSSGEVVTVPPRSALPVALRRLAPGEVISGICALALKEGPSSLIVRTDALHPQAVDPLWLDLPTAATPWVSTGARPLARAEFETLDPTEHVYPSPFKQIEVDYRVGGRFGFVRIGQRPIPNANEQRALDGNFGVIYDVSVQASNPTPRPESVQVVFEASAGYSGAVFFYNGRLLRAPLLLGKQEFVLEEFRLEPGQTRRIDLKTIPLSGSSYPATLTVRPREIASMEVRR